MYVSCTTPKARSMSQNGCSVGQTWKISQKWWIHKPKRWFNHHKLWMLLSIYNNIHIIILSYITHNFWRLRCRKKKSLRVCGTKYVPKSKGTKHHYLTTFGSWGVEKVHTCVARSTSPSETCKELMSTEHFWTLSSDVVLRGRHQGLCTLPQV